MDEREDRLLSQAVENIVNQPGAVGEEQLPSGINKTDKQEWDYTDRRIKKDTLFKRIVDWGTKEWGY